MEYRIKTTSCSTMPSVKTKGGFTLLEMTVSIGVFTIILFIATSAFLTMVGADRKSRAVRIASDNLNLSLEDMQRRIRTGSSYYCGAGGEGAGGGVKDCPTAAPYYSYDTKLSFTAQDGVTRITYFWDSTNKAVYRAIGVNPPVRMTSPEISVDSLLFGVRGSTYGVGGGGVDTNQPHVTIKMKGSIGAVAAPSEAKTGFFIQTTITQRVYDN